MKKYLALLSIGFCLSAYTDNSSHPFRAFQTARHNINQIEMCITNFGKFGQRESPYEGAGLWWPKGTSHTYIYGAGVWFGTVTGDGDTLTTTCYNPANGTSECAPGIIDMSVDDPEAIIYMYPDNWPASATTFPTAPQRPFSHQDSWCAFNDLDTAYHTPGDTRPIGIEIYQTVYAWNYVGLQDILCVMFEVKNVSEHTIDNCYIGVCADNDIGNEAGEGNDLVTAILGRWYYMDGESIWVDNLGYQWQEEIEYGNPSWWPGTIAFDYLQSPYDLVPGQDKDGDGIPDQYERDSAYFVNNVPVEQWDVDGDGTPDWRDPSQIPQLGMTAFKQFEFDNEPENDAERYCVLAGYDFKTGTYKPYDTIIPLPDDQRFLMSSGPFSLETDSVVTLIMGILLADWRDIYLQPDTALVMVDYFVQSTYNRNWLLPGPPPTPRLTCVPGDAQITLVWDKAAETAKDPYYAVVSNPDNPNLYDPYYREVDFEGYGVWKSLDGQAWQLLDRYDAFNDIVFEDTTQPDSTRVYADNSGLVHYFIDPDVRNGFPYYYAVTAYDYNWVKEDPDTFRAIWFESGLVSVAATARRDPANYQAGSFSIAAVSGNPLLADSNVGVVITYPMQMTSDPFALVFSPIVRDSASGDAVYSALLYDAADSLLDAVSVAVGVGGATFYEFGTRNGLSITAFMSRPNILSTVSIFDRVEVVSGDYPPDNLVPVAMVTNWAYRGNDYEVHWYKAYGSVNVNSVVVLDVQSGDTIPFKPYGENAATDTLADGWCFRSLSVSTDTLQYGATAVGTRNLYINGGKFKLKLAGQLNVGDPRPGDGDVWMVYANTTYPPVAANARLAITVSPAQYTTEQVTLHVKVVPNPYLIHNEWQREFNPRRIKFINLPSECTIRIFNLNGELVRTLSHVSTLEPGIGEQEVLGSAGGDEWWDLLSDNRQLIASGVYIFHIQSDVGEQVGKFVVIR